jgi:hypothetical protein
MTIEAQLQLLLATLARGSRTATELKQALGGISPATLSRLMSRLGGQVVALGQTRAIRYARPRDVRGVGSRFPFFRVDVTGDAHRYGELQALLGGGFWLQQAKEGLRGELFPHLPWFIQDLRPDGFMGRAFAQRVGADLGLPPRLTDWHDDHLLVALARRGEDVIGNLIVGEESLARYLAAAQQPPCICSSDDYPRLAEAALAGDPAGSSAAGEQPKFSVSIERDGAQVPVLVKFSPPVATLEGERWSDLLVCEHLALGVVREAGIAAATSRIIFNGGRAFLEVERFDRVGRLGRLPLHSLGVIDDQFFGHRDNWAAMAGRLEQTGMIAADECDSLIWLDLFGAMIGNSDRHFGNVSLVPSDSDRNRFHMAPVYDMLPMCHRPRSGEEISFTTYSPPPVISSRPDLVDSARWQATNFWEMAAADERISAPFRSLCAANLTALLKFGEGPRVSPDPTPEPSTDSTTSASKSTPYGIQYTD